jgi:hypothetical protein
MKEMAGCWQKRASSLRSPLNRGGCDWDPLKYTAHLILGRSFKQSTGKTETPTESIGALVDHVSAWNRLEMMDMLLELGTPRTPAANNADGNQIIRQIE